MEQIKVFAAVISDKDEGAILEKKVNDWLKKNKEINIISRSSSLAVDGEEAVCTVVLFYEK